MKWVSSSILTRTTAAALALACVAGNAQAPGAPVSLSRPAGGNNAATEPFDFASSDGFTSLFDGKTLNGWSGDSNWSVKDGNIYINPTCEKPTGTIYLVWQGGELSNFILKYEFKGNGRVNGGMQFRSYLSAAPTGTTFPPRPPRPPAPPRPAGAPAAGGPPPGGRGPACANPGTPPSKEAEAKWDLLGPQADFDAGNNYSGMFYEQGGRGIAANPGFAYISEAGKPNTILATLADKPTLNTWFNKEDWNQFVIVAAGPSVSIYMNNHLVTQFIDTDPKYFRPSGKIGIEVESTGEYWIRNVSLKKLN